MFRLISFVLLLSIGCICSEPLLPSIAAKSNKVFFVYPAGKQSERDLSVCPENSVCNVIHKRYWFPPLVERLCKCPQRHECYWTWSDNSEKHTMMLENRSQMKFCTDLTELPTCSLKKPAIRLITQSPKQESQTSQSLKGRNSQKNNRYSELRNVTAFCNCQDPHYWKLKVNSTKYDEKNDHTQQTYMCSKLKKCSKMEFCGYVRADTYSISYRCSCPKGHMCISKDKTKFKMEEMLYNGTGYKAFCYPVKNMTKAII